MGVPPGLTVMKLGVGSVTKAQDDPENSMTLALTQRECAIVSFGNMLICYLFPELIDYCNQFANKMLEVGVAQDYLPPIDEV